MYLPQAEKSERLTRLFEQDAVRQWVVVVRQVKEQSLDAVWSGSLPQLRLCRSFRGAWTARQLHAASTERRPAIHHQQELQLSAIPPAAQHTRPQIAPGKAFELQCLTKLWFRTLCPLHPQTPISTNKGPQIPLPPSAEAHARLVGPQIHMERSGNVYTVTVRCEEGCAGS